MTIGAVVVSRNDNYGGNLIERASFCLNALMNTMDQVIYVDWNSESISLIEEIKLNLVDRGNLLWIRVTPEQAKNLLGQDQNRAQACVEVLGRNIALRRITTDYVLSTNIDVIVPPRRFFESLTDKKHFYVGARRNTPLEAVQKVNGDQEKLVEIAEQFGQVGDSGAYPGDVWSLVNCCGDFQYTHIDNWYALRGFEESLVGRGFTDSNMQKKAALGGFELKVMREIPFFHINHGGGFGGSGGINDMNKAIKNFTRTENKETWGFSNVDFETWRLKNTRMPNIFSNLFEKKSRIKSDINEHMNFLKDVVIASDAKQVVELGVRDGGSSISFLAGLFETDGKLWSCDLQDPQGEINTFVNNSMWRFNRGDDLSPEILEALPKEYDIVFIDTGHFFEGTLLEMETYFEKLKPGGLMILHDSNEPNYMGEYAAIMVFLDRHKKCDFYNFPHNHGLAVICKNKKFSDNVKALLK